MLALTRVETKIPFRSHFCSRRAAQQRDASINVVTLKKALCELWQAGCYTKYADLETSLMITDH
jgi:hypothetical protein